MTNFFLSSTFHDMQSERDMIIRRVLPTIKEYAHTLGLDVSITDLRWGIDTSQMDNELGMSKILSVCMRELDYCYPHIIILLGDRYGSIPPEDLVMRFCSKKLSSTKTPEHFLGKSITEMEILYALFSGKVSPANVTICIRESLDCESMPEDVIARFVSTDPCEVQKLHDLKVRLIDAFPDCIMRYSAKWNKTEEKITGLETFCETLTQRLLNQLQSIHGFGVQTKEERQFNQDCVFMQSQIRGFSGRQKQLEELSRFLQSDSEQILLLTGPSGSGKSSLLANFAQKAKETANVIVLFCGNGNELSHTTDLMYHLSWRLCRMLDIDSTPYLDTTSVPSWRKRIARLMSQCSTEKPLLLILDALDALRYDDLLKNAAFIPDLALAGKNVKLLISTTEDITIPGLIKATSCLRTTKLDPISNDDIWKMIDLQMALSHKEIPRSTVRLLHNICAYKSALYVSLLLSRFDLLSRQDYNNIRLLMSKETNDAKALYAYIESELSTLPQSEGDLALHLLCKVQSELQYSPADSIIQILCAFPEGIRSEDVIEILHHMGIQSSLLEMKIFLRSIRGLIRRTQDDRILFKHQLIYRSIASQNAGDIRPVLSAAYQHFICLPDLDPVKQVVFLKICYLLDNPQAAADFIANTNRLEEQASGKGDSNVLNATNNVLRALQTVYSYYGPEQVFRFVQNLLAAASKTDDTFYHVCSAFLFTLDTFFTEEMPQAHKSDLMQNLYHSATNLLYPNKDRNRLYLRLLYICCEQNGIRATSYEEQSFFYQEFNRLCLEFIASLTNDYEHTIDIVRDLSLSYEKVASLYVERNWQLAIELFDKAIQVAKSDLHDSNRPYLLLDQYHNIRIARAQCILRQALLYQRIGWDNDTAMQHHLPDAENALLEALDYLLNSQHLTKKHHSISRCYSNLADLARLHGNSEAELRASQNMLKHAREAYRSDNSIVLMDWVRNAEFRLGCSTALPDEDQRLMHLQNAFALALKVKQYSPTQTANTIVFHCATALLKAYQKKVQLHSTHRTSSANTMCSELCIRCLSEMTPILELLFAQDEGKQNYDSILFILRLTTQLIEDWHSLAVSHCRAANMLEAFAAAKWTYDLSNALKDHINRNNWLRQMMDICQLFKICCHNSRVFTAYTDAYDSKHSQRMLNQELSVQSRLISLILCYEAEYGADAHSKKYLQESFQHISHSMCLCDGWLTFAEEYLSNPKKVELFWTYLETIRYSIPNWRTVYLDAMFHPNFQENTERLYAIGKYLCKHISEQRVQKLLYFSVLFENIALEYAYQSMNYSTALKIIENGYDRYLELSTLYIIRCHDRHKYLSLVHELKFHCLSVHRQTIRSRRFYHVLDRHFLDEADELFRQILLTRHAAPLNDPRLHTPRSVFLFEK